MIFLLEYDRCKGKVSKFKSFASSERAQAQRERLDIEVCLHRAGVPHEVVLLEAADEQTLKRTHQRYFKTASEIVESMTQS
jgi:hypothetical protein